MGSHCNTAYKNYAPRAHEKADVLKWVNRTRLARVHTRGGGYATIALWSTGEAASSHLRQCGLTVLSPCFCVAIWSADVSTVRTLDPSKE